MRGGVGEQPHNYGIYYSDYANAAIPTWYKISQFPLGETDTPRAMAALKSDVNRLVIGTAASGAYQILIGEGTEDPAAPARGRFKLHGLPFRPLN